MNGFVYGIRHKKGFLHVIRNNENVIGHNEGVSTCYKILQRDIAC